MRESELSSATVPFVFDHVFDTVNDDEISLLVQKSHIAGPVPARLQQALAGRLLVVLVTPESFSFSIQSTVVRDLCRNEKTYIMIVGQETQTSPGCPTGRSRSCSSKKRIPILARRVPVATRGAPSSRTPLCEMHDDVSVQP